MKRGGKIDRKTRAGGAPIGLIGLGVMGRNLALNMADQDFPVAVYNRTAEKTRLLMGEAETAGRIRPGYDLAEFTGLLAKPRSVLIMVSAGPPVDAVIGEILPFLEPGDLLADCGNSHFTETDRRARELAERGILYLGVGVSGGERGARFGSSLMVGGPPEAYGRVREIFESIAARADGEPCVALLGAGSAGHYVKMVHNGIEYALMQLIAETYDLMKRGLGLGNDELKEIYEEWGRWELKSFLVEITAEIFRRLDERTGQRLVDVILDRAEQKGTGKWVSESALDLKVPVPTIDAALALRHLSGCKEEREEASRVLPLSIPVFRGDPRGFIDQFRNSLYAGMILSFAQGFYLLRRASAVYGYGLKLEEVARIWRGGCIIRAALLEGIRAAFRAHPDLPHLLLDPPLGREVLARTADLRAGVCQAVGLGIPAPALAVSLAYFDACRSAWLPANLIQAQRDYFGAHTYRRIDLPGTFHTDWDQA